MEINDKLSIIASNLAPQINLVTESVDTLSAISDYPVSSQLNSSSVAKFTFYAQQRIQQKLQNVLKQSSNRLKKFHALCEKYRRLTKKVLSWKMLLLNSALSVRNKRAYGLRDDKSIVPQ